MLSTFLILSYSQIYFTVFLKLNFIWRVRLLLLCYRWGSGKGGDTAYNIDRLYISCTNNKLRFIYFCECMRCTQNKYIYFKFTYKTIGMDRKERMGGYLPEIVVSMSPLRMGGNFPPSRTQSVCRTDVETIRQCHILTHLHSVFCSM